MFRPLAFFLFVILAVGICCPDRLSAQTTKAARPTVRKKKTITTGPRKLAKGVLTTIQPDREEKETFSGPRPVVEIVQGTFPAWDPHYLPKSMTIKEIAKEATFRRKIWCLELAFKNPRMITVDLSQPNGKFEKKLIWYLLYRVRNTGAHVDPAAKPDEWGHKIYNPARENYTIRFFPHFVLEANDQKKAYLDRIIPKAVEAIRKREDPNIKLYDSVGVSQIDIPLSTDQLSKPVWGVATWEDIDPRTDEFSIFIEGLSNAYRFEDPPGAYQAGDAPGTGRRYAQKALQLNFSRPGDIYDPNEDEIRYGIRGKVDYQWIFR